ncbi:MAG: hypothetical protein LBJ58_03730 [Tannerellaceae bacterium]|jgi:hypothetical protein|nr:hypothetical protein [Tannerellaceae bacterium]
MTDDQDKLLAVFEVRVQDLLSICDRQKQKINDLACSLESKEGELRQAMQTIDELKARCNSMLTARIVSTSEQEVKNAKMRLARLVREVDACITLLKK